MSLAMEQDASQHAQPVRTPSTAGRRIIVTADDFGLASEVNRAIARAHRDGILTSTSLMVAGPAAAEAVELARQLPRLAVGLHLVLVQGRAVLTPQQGDGLVRRDGTLREAAIPAAIRYFFSPVLRRAVAREMRAQLERFRQTGLSLDHVDGHLNIHLHPLMQNILVDLVPEFGIRALRLTRDPLEENLRYDSRSRTRKTFEAFVFAVLSNLAAKRFAERGVVFADHLYGLHQSGHMDETYLQHLIPRLPDGVSELYGHPAEAQTPEMKRCMPGYEPGAELAALTSPRVRALLEEHGVERITYGDLVAERSQ